MNFKILPDFTFLLEDSIEFIHKERNEANNCSDVGSFQNALGWEELKDVVLEITRHKL